MADTTREAIQTARLATQTTLTAAQLKYGDDAQDIRDELDLVITAGTSLDTYKPVWSTLTADSADVNASEVVVASGLTVTTPIAGTYVLKAVLPYTTAAAADIQIKFGGTATVTATVGTSDLFIVNAPSGDATAATVPLRLATSWTTAYTLATTGAPAANNPIVVEGKLVVTVAGTIIVSFAQGTSNGSNTHIDSGAYLMIQRVA
jgi:hypothetical protein